MWIDTGMPARSFSVRENSRGGRPKAGSAMLAAVFAISLGLALPMSLAHASIVADGSFDAPSGGPGFTNLTPTQTFGAWTVTGSGNGPFGPAGVDLIGGYWAAPSLGGGSVDLDGFAPGGITQSIANLAAGSYLLSFYLSGNPDGWPATKTVEVTIGNVVVPFTYTLTGANSLANMNYQLETVKFTLNSPATIPLSFRSLDSDGSPWGPVIGDVSISAVPEPTTWAMMIIGFFGLGIMAHRRKGHSRRSGAGTALNTDEDCRNAVLG